MSARTTANQPSSVAMPMTRKEFLRTLAIGATGLASGFTGFGIKLANAQLAAAEVAVYPTGQFPFDVNEVSAAVNGGVGPSSTSYPGGGIVRLKATDTSGKPMFFNFGGAYTAFPGPSNPGRGSVPVMRDVTILGETMSPTSMIFPFDPIPDPGYIPDRTVIYGGKRAFFCPPSAPAPPNLTVRSIFFAYPSLSAVQATKTAGFDVSDCVMYDVKPDDTGLRFWIGSGMEATGLVTSANQLFGDFKAMNNRIRRVSPTTIPVPPIALDAGIILSQASMRVQIMANEIEMFPFHGVAIGQNDGAGTVAANDIANCGYGGQPLAGSIGTRGMTSSMLIERNSVTGGYAGPSLSLPSKRGIVLASSNVVVRSNTIDGVFALQSIFVSSFPFAGQTWFATDNRFENNDLSSSTAMLAQVLLETGCDRNRFTNNDYGSVGPDAQAGMIVQSSTNAFINEDFWGTYSGIGGQPCVLLTSTSSGNAISAFKYEGAPQGFDVCNQVLDEGANTINGGEKCR